MQSAHETPGAAAPVVDPLELESSWEAALRSRIQLYGHRNWIVIADSAYPAQAREGIETIRAAQDPFEVLRRSLSIVQSSSHVKPSLVVDRELEFLSEQDAPGVSAYRRELAKLLGGVETAAHHHEQIIAELDKAASVFRILIIKTGLRIPYSSVFLKLECAYWDAKAEGRLRKTMAAYSRDSPENCAAGKIG